MLEPRIETIDSRKFIGKSVEMSVAQNKTPDVWRSFMPKMHGVKSRIGNKFYAIQVYDSLGYFEVFSPNKKFTQWAAVEVHDFENQPLDMKQLKLDAGLYAVFVHKGLASEFGATLMHILSVWLPKSKYQLADRPHFQLMGDKYKNNDPSSEEEVWVPIDLRK